MTRDLTKLTYKRLTWDDVLTGDSFIRAMLNAQSIGFEHLPTEKRWSPHPSMMYGGYYVCPDGDCYIPF